MKQPILEVAEISFDGDLLIEFPEYFNVPTDWQSLNGTSRSLSEQNVIELLVQPIDG